MECTWCFLWLFWFYVDGLRNYFRGKFLSVRNDIYWRCRFGEDSSIESSRLWGFLCWRTVVIGGSILCLCLRYIDIRIQRHGLLLNEAEREGNVWTTILEFCRKRRVAVSTCIDRVQKVLLLSWSELVIDNKNSWDRTNWESARSTVILLTFCIASDDTESTATCFC